MIPMSIPGVSRPEPRWPAILAAFAAIALHFALPIPLRFGTPWVLATIVVILIGATQYARYRNMPTLNTVLAFSIIGVHTSGCCGALTPPHCAHHAPAGRAG
jgi:hypothetical protein